MTSYTQHKMARLKFKIQPTISLFTAANHCRGPLRKQKKCGSTKSKSHVRVLFVRSTVVEFCIFCGQPVVAVVMIGNNKTRKSLVGVEVIYQTRDTVFHHISSTEKRVENTTRSGVFLTNFEVFDIGMKHCDECLI